jgi:hypothetical protein
MTSQAVDLVGYSASNFADAAFTDSNHAQGSLENRADTVGEFKSAEFLPPIRLR